MRPTLAAAAPLVVAIGWTATLVAEPGPLPDHSVLLVGVGLLLTSAIATIGMVVTAGAWAHRLSLAVVALGLVVASMRHIDAWWVVAVALTALGGIAINTPLVTHMIRKLPPATGPPGRVVMLSLILMLAPVVIGLGGLEPAALALTVGLGAPVAAFMFTRVLPGGLMSVRSIWPALAVSSAFGVGMPRGLLAVALGGVVAYLAWHPDVKTSFHPPRETGSRFPIPPQLVPREILGAAGLDDEGKRR